MFVKCVVWAGELTSPSRPLSGQLTFWPALAMRKVSEPAGVGWQRMAALVASVIVGLRREEAGQRGRQLFSRSVKRAFSHLSFLKDTLVRIHVQMFTISVYTSS